MQINRKACFSFPTIGNRKVYSSIVFEGVWGQLDPKYLDNQLTRINSQYHERKS